MLTTLSRNDGLFQTPLGHTRKYEINTGTARGRPNLVHKLGSMVVSLVASLLMLIMLIIDAAAGVKTQY